MAPGHEFYHTDSMYPQRKPGFFPPEVLDLMIPPLKVGACTGTAGIFGGMAGAILRDTNVFISASSSGIQFFMLGSGFWFTRSVGIRAYGDEDKMRPIDKVAVSGVAGSSVGAISGLLRGPARIIPGIITWGLIGSGGQAITNVASKWLAASRAKKRSNESWLWRWSPMKKMSDEEYVDMMDEKILKLDARLAIMTDKLNEMKAALEAEESAKGVEHDR
ncbi:hypothetical protein E4U60_005296 [Claviceps pazoutovae]|uniref:Uncharacterized protein n=1 Tax=Claviceps pazoutovae TaxID=1649127 RepID=A0A9P7MH24_9HYPO|nr:hypothetical protein E4U60_005296 [Claviceps pazoutovae]